MFARPRCVRAFFALILAPALVLRLVQDVHRFLMRGHLTIATVTPRRWPRHRRRLLSPVFGVATVASHRHLPSVPGPLERLRYPPARLRFDHLAAPRADSIPIVKPFFAHRPGDPT